LNKANLFVAINYVSQEKNKQNSNIFLVELKERIKIKKRYENKSRLPKVILWN